MSHSIKIGVIADDFTGAADSGVQFARYGLDTYLGISSLPDCPVLVFNTASREIAPEEASERCFQAAGTLDGRLLFKKIDSTLRGHIAAELDGLLRAASGRRIVVCPSAPGQGRMVKDGILYVHGVPLHESPFKDDPVFPARASNVTERVGAAAAHLDLNIIRRPVDELARMILAAPARVITVDAIDEADLLRISQAVIQAGAIPCGALGFAAAWVEALTGRQPAPRHFALPTPTRPVLIVTGSANACSHAQINTLAAHPDSLVCHLGVPVDSQAEADLFAAVDRAWDHARAVVLCPAVQETVQDPAWRMFGQTASRLAAAILRRRKPSALVIAGGETANHLCGLLGVGAFQLLGEAAPGIPFGRMLGGDVDGLTLITKAGGFGQVDCLEKLVYG